MSHEELDTGSQSAVKWHLSGNRGSLGGLQEAHFTQVTLTTV